MKAEEGVLETIGIVAHITLLLLAVVFCCLLVFMTILSPTKTPIEEIRLNDRQIIKIWYQVDINHPEHGIWYEITQANEVVVPATMITVIGGIDPSYNIQVDFAQDKTLVLVYDSEYRDQGLLILYDAQTGVSWPYMSHAEDWKIPYAQLRAENPDLPKVGGYFGIDDG